MGRGGAERGGDGVTTLTEETLIKMRLGRRARRSIPEPSLARGLARGLAATAPAGLLAVCLSVCFSVCLGRPACCRLLSQRRSAEQGALTKGRLLRNCVPLQ